MSENFEIKTAAVTDRGLSEKRPQNEDSYLSLPEHGIFAVADGVGGAMAGDVASQMAVEILGEAFSNYSASVDPEEIMTVAIDRANTAINQMASELPQLSSMATTIVALHVSGNVATIAHVGDSRLYRLDREGRLYRETEDHSVVEEEVRAGRMSAEQAANHPSRNVISRAVGAEMTVDVDVRSIILEPGTMFLLCSDGITRHISDQEIADLLITGMDLPSICDQMKEICFSRGAEDNLTAVIVAVPDDERRDHAAGTALPREAAEEETVASARTAPVEEEFPAAFEESSAAEFPADVPAYAATEPDVSADDDAYLMEQDLGAIDEPETAAPNVDEFESSRLSVPANAKTEPAAERSDLSIFGQTNNAQREREVSSGSVAGTVFRSLLYLLLGGLIGAGVVYYLWQAQPEPEPQVLNVESLEPRTNNVPASALEESRQIVDRDPNAYLLSNAASTRSAEDHYLLGRALFLAEKPFEAKKQFALAQEKMADADPKSVPGMRTDIAMMTAVIDDAQAAENFKRNFGLLQQQAAQTAANTAVPTNTANTNSAVQ